MFLLFCFGIFFFFFFFSSLLRSLSFFHANIHWLWNAKINYYLTWTTAKQKEAHSVFVRFKLRLCACLFMCIPFTRRTQENSMIHVNFQLALRFFFLKNATRLFHTILIAYMFFVRFMVVSFSYRFYLVAHWFFLLYNLPSPAHHFLFSFIMFVSEWISNEIDE